MRFLFLFLALLGPMPAFAKAPEPGSDVVAELYPQYDGIPVGKITIVGLKRSRESFVRWMLGARIGEPFDSQTWQTGIEHLYKTESVYDLHTAIDKVSVNGHEELLIQLSLEDKWTLFPYFDIQGGGGSVSYTAGIFDTNLLGTFTNVYLGGGYLDGEYSYELGASQKWFLQSTYSLAIDISKISQPVGLQNSAGNLLQTFTWARARQAATLGKQNGERVYWELGFEAFRDTLRETSLRTSTFLFNNMEQFRITPSFHLWKVSHSDYLEQGHELIVSGFDANPANPDRDYHGVQAAWKQVIFLPDTRNIAYYLGFSHMTSAPVAYQFRLGGFDSVRGFGVNRIFGLDSARANFEYRSTILIAKMPFFDLDRMVLQGAFFSDLGNSWNSAGIDLSTGQNTQKDTRFLYSAGAGLRAIFLHFANATVRLDVARAIVPQEGFNVGFGVGQFF
ncbi:MAG: BamA/TamA family outer membrane protein [Bdellovibrionota bacterium]